MNVWFIDTSVLDHIVPVPGWSKAGSPDRQDIALLMGERVDSGDSEPFSPGGPLDWRGSARWCGRDWAGGGGGARGGRPG